MSLDEDSRGSQDLWRIRLGAKPTPRVFTVSSVNRSRR